MKYNFKKYLVVALALFGFFVLPEISQAATLYLNPSSGNFGVGSTITVSVRTNTQGQAVNTAEANISYSTDTLELVRATQGATFYLPSPGSPTRGNGTAYFGGGLPNPGYNGSGGTLGTLTFRAKAVGSATINVTNGKVLLNDGNGTDALQGTTTARFNITPPPVGAVTVSSSTHADTTKWYQARKADLTWNRPNGVYGYSFELNQDPNSVPDDTLDTTVTSNKSYDNLKDGTWFFHIKGRGQTTGFGSTTHFAVNVDTVAPLSFEAKVSNDNTEKPQIEFATTDETSGIERYQISVDGKPIEENAQSPYTLNTSGGDHKVTIIAYDKAGNAQASEVPVNVKGAPGLNLLTSNFSLPAYVLMIFGLLILILLMLNVWLLARGGVRSYGSDPANRLQSEIDEMLEKLRLDIDKRLLSLSSESTDNIFEKETKVAKAVSSDISKARRKIDTKIERASRKR